MLQAEAIPISADARLMNDARSPLEHALGDGEDFELLFAVSPKDGEQLLRDQPIAGMELFRIGELASDGLWIEEAGLRRPLAPTGYVHELE